MRNEVRFGGNTRGLGDGQERGGCTSTHAGTFLVSPTLLQVNPLLDVHVEARAKFVITGNIKLILIFSWFMNADTGISTWVRTSSSAITGLDSRAAMPSEATAAATSLAMLETPSASASENLAIRAADMVWGRDWPEQA